MLWMRAMRYNMPHRRNETRLRETQDYLTQKPTNECEVASN